MYYTRITVQRLSHLLFLSDKVPLIHSLTVSFSLSLSLSLSLSQELESFLSDLVTKKTVYARIDRPAGIISFRQQQDPSAVLNSWSANLNSLMSLVSRTTHLINKEEMIHSIVKY